MHRSIGFLGEIFSASRGSQMRRSFVLSHHSGSGVFHASPDTNIEKIRRFRTENMNGGYRHMI